jgi:hypothetical protein
MAEEQGQGGINGGNGSDNSNVGVFIHTLISNSIRLGDAAVMNQGGSEQEQGENVNIHITTLNDPNYNDVSTRVTFTDGTHRDLDWDDVVTEQTTIDDGLLDGNTYEWTKNIRAVHFGIGVKRVTNWAFSYCDTLESVTWEEAADSVITVEGGAFSYCPNATDENGFLVLTGRLCCIDPSKVGSNVVVPDEAMIIAPNAFANSQSGKVTSITFPNVVSFRPGAFQGSDYLTDIYLAVDIETAQEYEPEDYTAWDLGVKLEPDQQTGGAIAVQTQVVIHCTDGTIQKGYDTENNVYYPFDNLRDSTSHDVITHNGI